MLSDISNIYMEARRAQVDALNGQKFSDAEYTWVRNRIYEAAGMEVASGIDLSQIEALARESAMKSNVRLPDIKKPNVPEANRQARPATPGQVEGVDPASRLRAVDRREPGAGIREPDDDPVV